MAVALPRHWRDLTFPTECACCGAATDERWNTVPYCRECRQHARRGGRGAALLIAACLAAGAGAGLLCRRALAFDGLIEHLLLTAAAALAPVLAALTVLRPRKLGPQHTRRGPAVDFLGLGKTVFHNDEYGRRVAEASGVPAHPGPPPWGLSVGLLVAAAALAPVLAVGWFFPGWHLRVYVDSAETVPLAVRAGGRVLARVPAAKRVAVTVPRDPLTLEVVGPDGAVLDKVTLYNPQAAGVRVFNVRERRCYALRTVEYSNMGFGVGFAGVHILTGKLITASADFLFEAAPEKIQVPKGSLPMATRTVLEVAPCDTPETE